VRRVILTGMLLVGVAVLVSVAGSRMRRQRAPRDGAALAQAAAPTDPARDNPAVFLFDDFEGGSFAKWDNDDQDFGDPDLRIVNDPAVAHSGTHCLEVTAREGEGTGGKLAKWFMPGVEDLYARWYCKFATDFDQGNHMHFVHLLGGPPDNKWAAFGKAGVKPSGTDFFTTGFEPWRDWGKHPAPGAMMFYSYYPDMQKAPDGNYWGNMFMTDPPFVPERDRWYCMEVHVKLNTPGQADGEQAAWVDGQEVGRFTGIRWREIPALKLNCFWLMLYVHNSTHPNRVYFDDAALSTSPIGPAK